jgi:hypothetical protein
VVAYGKGILPRVHRDYAFHRSQKEWKVNEYADATTIFFDGEKLLLFAAWPSSMLAAAA